MGLKNVNVSASSLAYKDSLYSSYAIATWTSPLNTSKIL